MLRSQQQPHGPRRVRPLRRYRRPKGRDNRMRKNSVSHRPNAPADFATPSRRNVLFHVGAAFSAVASVLMAIPIIGYVFSAFSHKRIPPQQWIGLGDISKYPPGQTWLASFRNPFTRPWDGATGDIPCW